MGCAESSEKSPSPVHPSHVDLRKDPNWKPENVWVCDIEERAGEGDNDFLFEANLTADGTTEVKDGSKSEKFTAGRCVFGPCMYDIQKFQPDVDYDGRLNFTIKFGVNTVERKDAVDGWSVEFISLMTVARPKSFEGTIKTSWWGERKVKLINYSTLTAEEIKRYPDLIAPYYKTIGMQNNELLQNKV